MHELVIDHVQITVPPEAESVAREFYCELLSLPELEKPDSLKGRGGFWLLAGNQQIHVGTEQGVDRFASKAHIAYRVDDLEFWRQRLQDYGIEIGESVPIPGFDRFECRDPFGNRLEFIEPL